MDLREYAVSKAREYGIPETLFVSLIDSESAFVPDARAYDMYGTGGVGIAQFVASTARQYGLSRQQRLDPYASLDASARYVRDLLNRYGGNWLRAVNAYKGNRYPQSAANVVKRANSLQKDPSWLERFGQTMMIPGAAASTLYERLEKGSPLTASEQTSATHWFKPDVAYWGTILLVVAIGIFSVKALI